MQKHNLLKIDEVVIESLSRINYYVRTDLLQITDTYPICEFVEPEEESSPSKFCFDVILECNPQFLLTQMLSNNYDRLSDSIL